MQAVPGLTVVGILLASPGRAGVQFAVSAYVAGAVLQLVAGLASRSKQRFFVCARSLADPETRAVGIRSLRPLAASAIQLATRVVELIAASFLAPGSITILTYANRLVSAVGGTLLFKPVMTALSHPWSTPRCRQHRCTAKNAARRAASDAPHLSVAHRAGLAGGAPFVAGLFAAGDFTADQARLLGITVAVYAASLPTAAIQRMLLGVTFARLDTTTYLRNTVYGAVANLLLLGAAMALWRPPMLLMVPIAYSLAQIVNVWHAATKVRAYLGEVFAGLRVVIWPLALVVAAAVSAMIPIRLWLAPDLTARPQALIAGGLATCLVGALALGVGALLVTPTEVRQVIRRSL